MDNMNIINSYPTTEVQYESLWGFIRKMAECILLNQEIMVFQNIKLNESNYFPLNDYCNILSSLAKPLILCLKDLVHGATAISPVSPRPLLNLNHVQFPKQLGKNMMILSNKKQNHISTKKKKSWYYHYCCYRIYY